ncbi:C40 family peptidase [Trichlorobacter ammonificans]|uniref:NLP/P60 protein n=1 Tax=Trichlorobacter ammonificans TaxID=2916410 RepID=A0ABN8HFY4_9BACT|nr:C40 family peptidase [Trichlorobacter ammonificans]CAH2030058.1 NLP/P60 protein [Trichlorobacter ammonificans]
MKHRLHLIAALSLLLLNLPLPALATKTHIVRTNETLTAIARKYRVSAEEIKTLNHLSSNRLLKGSTIIIPTREQKTATSNTDTCGSYTVASGDTLPAIARKTGLRMTELRRLNKLKGNKVREGQVLALGDAATCSTTVAQAPRDQRLKLISTEMLNEQEFNATLAELTDIDTDSPVDLAKNLEERNRFASLKQSAYSFLGARYRFGGNSRTALDCSSFTQQVFREQKVGLPRTAREQFLVGSEVPRGDLRKGDLVFFRTYASFPSHVGIYLGNRKMIHASSKDRRVVISSMDTPYYLSRYLGARRIEQINPDTFDIQDLMLGVDEERDGDVQQNDHLGLGLMEALVK